MRVLLLWVGWKKGVIGKIRKGYAGAGKRKGKGEPKKNTSPKRLSAQKSPCGRKWWRLKGTEKKGEKRGKKGPHCTYGKLKTHKTEGVLRRRALGGCKEGGSGGWKKEGRELVGEWAGEEIRTRQRKRHHWGANFRGKNQKRTIFQGGGTLILPC